MANKSSVNARDSRDPGSIPGFGRSPGVGRGNSLQCSGLENPVDRGAWGATVHRLGKSWTWLQWLSTQPSKLEETAILVFLIYIWEKQDLEILSYLRLRVQCCNVRTWKGFPGGSAGKESTCNVGNLSLIPGVGKIPWRREWLPTPVFWPEEFHGL